MESIDTKQSSAISNRMDELSYQVTSFVIVHKVRSLISFKHHSRKKRLTEFYSHHYQCCMYGLLLQPGSDCHHEMTLALVMARQIFFAHESEAVSYRTQTQPSIRKHKYVELSCKNKACGCAYLVRSQRCSKTREVFTTA